MACRAMDKMIVIVPSKEKSKTMKSNQEKMKTPGEKLDNSRETFDERHDFTALEHIYYKRSKLSETRMFEC